ncbi:MAG: hypothetical protein V4505_07175 [Pseudomonadota bacterium]
MRSLFGIVALLVTLAIVALVVKQQMRATGLAVPAAVSTPGAPGPTGATPVLQTPQAQMGQAQQQVMDGLAAADREAQQRRDAAEQAAGK